MTNGGVTESYTYDADGERVAKTVGGVTTVYLQGLWEQIVGGASTRYYPFNGQVVALRDSATNAVTSLHGDHLGSVSLATDSSGVVVSRQDFDPWGKARGTSTIPQTSLNYTGQRLDGTGLLYYHARYYDPALARFVSADSVVPGQNTTAGPPNPQDLNRYSYVTNNPLNHADPTGHCGTSGFVATAVSVMSGDCTRRAYDALTKAKTTEGKVVSGAVMVASAVGAAAGWVGGAILAAAGVSAAVGAVAGGGTAAVAAETGGAVAAAASADGNPTNEISAVAAVDPTKLIHIFGKPSHLLDEFVNAQGGREQAFRALQDAANQALREGKLVPGPDGMLPNGDAGPIINVAGTQIRLLGGRVIDGVVRIATASRKGL